MKVGIVGRSNDTKHYEQFLDSMNVSHITSLSIGNLITCTVFLFPGGGDINPELFGETNRGSINIDTELDLLQLRAFQYAFAQKIPILGICKGMQLINVALGGTLIQHLPTADVHTNSQHDTYHTTTISPNSFLHALYGDHIIVNSRHHQSVDRLGTHLRTIQWCTSDKCIEAIEHTRYPIWGVQWHPERLDSASSHTNPALLFSYVLSYG